MNWRAAIKAHAAADLLPMVPDVELGELAKDIEENGLRSPLSLWRSLPGAEWQLLDGRNRVAAMARLRDGEDMIKGAIAAANQYEAHVDPLTFVISANIHRRHLKPEQKRDLIATVLKSDPSRSNRAIAYITRVDHHTVANVRNDSRDGGEIPHHEKRVGADGVAQAAHKPRTSTYKRYLKEHDREERKKARAQSTLRPIVSEHMRPSVPDEAPAASAPEPIKTMDERALDKALHRGRLSLGHALADRPEEALGIVLDLIGRLDLANKLPRDRRIDLAKSFVLALGLTAEDLGG